MAIITKLIFCSFLIIHANATAQDLSFNFYSQTCPSLEDIVANATANIISTTPSLAAGFLRLQFHDCFVRGCDGSVLINSTSSNVAEKDSIPNLSLRGFQEIESVKAAVESACPGVVSCADILALIARDAIVRINGPSWSVTLGRRDGTVSIAAEALANLPAPFFNISQLKSSFASKGLTTQDLVILSGGHTIGFSHCTSFSNRIYNFSSTQNVDPTLNPAYASVLQGECPQSNLSTNTVPMDPNTPNKFDVNYYTLVQSNKGLFQSDAALLNDVFTKSYVNTHSSNIATSFFFHDFGESMEKMIQIGVLTGSQGEIRKICSKVN